VVSRALHLKNLSEIARCFTGANHPRNHRDGSAPHAAPPFINHVESSVFLGRWLERSNQRSLASLVFECTATSCSFPGFLGPLAGSMLTIILPHRFVPYPGLAVAAFGAPRSCLPPHPRHRGSRRSEPVVESPWQYNRWLAHRFR